MSRRASRQASSSGKVLWNWATVKVCVLIFMAYTPYSECIPIYTVCQGIVTTGVRVNFKVPPPDPICRRCLRSGSCLLYTSDAADDLLCVNLGGRRIMK